MFLTAEQFHTLLQLRATWGLDGEDLLAEEVCADLARLGAHLRNNGPPGWLVLKRGLRKLNLLAEGLRLAGPTDAPKDVINL